MTITNQFLNDINDVAEIEDHTETRTGGDFERDIPEEGLTVCRLVSYVELGVHDGGSYQGKKKPDADYCRLVFELLGPKNIKEVEKEDGTKVKFGQLVSIKVKKSLSDKGKFKKLFNALTYGRNNIKLMPQMLGEAFLVTIRHGKSEDGKKTYVNVDKTDGSYTFAAPVIHDPLAQTTTPVQVPEPTVPLSCFLWSKPSKEQWDSIFIDGTREVKEKDSAGNEVVVQKSRNWIQETIYEAKNFPGSPIQLLLGGLSDLPNAGKVAGQEEVAPAEQSKPASTDEALAALAAAGINIQ